MSFSTGLRSLSIDSDPLLKAPQKSAAQEGPSFKEMLKEAFDAVNGAELRADQAAGALATGEVEDVHKVMLLTEKADLALQLTIQIRNKVVDAYQEISRMQI